MHILMQGDFPIPPNDGYIKDKLGRSWLYQSCLFGSAKHPAIVTVKRALADGKLAARDTNFAITMFPGYWVKK